MSVQNSKIIQSLSSVKVCAALPKNIAEMIAEFAMFDAFVCPGAEDFAGNVYKEHEVWKNIDCGEKYLWCYEKFYGKCAYCFSKSVMVASAEASLWKMGTFEYDPANHKWNLMKN